MFNAQKNIGFEAEFSTCIYIKDPEWEQGKKTFAREVGEKMGGKMGEKREGKMRRQE